MMRALTLWFVRKIRDEDSKSADPGTTLVVSQAHSHPGNHGPGLTVLGSVLCEGVPAPFPQGPHIA